MSQRSRAGLILAAVVVIVSVILAPWWPDYVAVCYIGAAVGTGEIVSRYRDAPQRALSTAPALLYILINAGAAIAALYFANVFGVAASQSPQQTTITRVLLAGFGAMAFFRTSVFTARIGEQDVAIGPVAFLQVILTATDRAVDRVRADDRARVVASAMSGVSFDAAAAALPAFCLALMQNLSADEEKALGEAINSLQQSTMDSETKSKNLGLLLLNVVGDKVLITAVQDLAPQIKAATAIVVTPPAAPVIVGTSVLLTVECRDSSGQLIERKRVAWSSDDPKIALVSNDGHVRGIAPGQTIIRAKADDATDAVTVEVKPTV